jgi:DNA polymerase alpha-associated DNA helicase A
MSSSSSSSPPQPTPIEFLSHLIHLTEQESLSESTESSLLLTNSPISLLVKNGLAITNLISNGFSISNTSLGGKTLVELKKNQAYGGGDSTGGRFEPHDFRIGDLARIKNSSGSSSKKKSSKNKGSSGKVEEEEEGIDSVVYKVQNDKITLVLNNTSEDGQFEWSDRITM